MNPYQPPIASVSRAPVELIQWCNVAWPSRKRKRVVQFFTNRRGNTLERDVIDFFTGRNSKLKSSENGSLLLDRLSKSGPALTIGQHVPGYAIKVVFIYGGDSPKVTCEYTPTHLSIWDRFTAKMWGAIHEVQQLADHCQEQ